MHVLLVNTEERFPESLGVSLPDFLARETLDSTKAQDEEDALSLLSPQLNYHFDAIMCGVPSTAPKFLSQIRSLGCNYPIIALIGFSGPSFTEHKIAFLDEGADQVVQIPLDIEELFAVTRAAVRRGNGMASNVIEIGDLKGDLTNRKVFCGEHEIRLTKTEWRILEILLRRKGKTVSRELILETIHTDPIEDPPGIKVVDVHIYNLRKRFTVACGNHIIGTDYGVGYFLSSDPPPIKHNNRN